MSDHRKESIGKFNYLAHSYVLQVYCSLREII